MQGIARYILTNYGEGGSSKTHALSTLKEVKELSLRAEFAWCVDQFTGEGFEPCEK